ncbi:MAG: hypothetical protein JJT85_11095 [Chromatiales bacterium]|nr:hypothetical protein [Chromatiales bacterium]
MSARPNVLPLSDEKTLRDMWKTVLAASPRGGGYLGDERNILYAMRAAPALVLLTRFNEFTGAVEMWPERQAPWDRPDGETRWLETDDTALTAWLQNQDIHVRSRSAVADSVLLVSQDNRFHPVREYLAGLTWDGEPRLNIWLAEYLNADGDPAYLAAVGRRFLLSAVARIMAPGCQADHSLVLEGPQGIGKTTAARLLAVRPEWYAGNLPDVHNKDAAMQLSGRWIIEIAELRAIRGSALEATKAFLTETSDVFRPPYGRRTVQVPRQCVFIATTNESEYLRDRSGNRRFWPVACGQVKREALAADVGQLWAEALHEYRQGEQWHLTPDEAAMATEQQHARLYQSELEADVAEFLQAELKRGKSETTVRDVLIYGLSVSPDAATYTDQARKLGPAVAEALQLAGWRRAGRTGTGDGRRTRYQYQGDQGTTKGSAGLVGA